MDVDGRTQNSKMDLTSDGDSLEISSEGQSLKFVSAETPAIDSTQSSNSKSNSSESTQSGLISGIWYSEENGL